MDDDVPEINRSPEACGHPDRPHVVRSLPALYCIVCGANVAAVILDRMRVALVRTEGDHG